MPELRRTNRWKHVACCQFAVAGPTLSLPQHFRASRLNGAEEARKIEF